MKSFYSSLTASQKRSLTISMRVLTNDYMDAYEWDMSHFKSKKIMINDLYFYWLRNCATKKYLWCQQTNERVFSDLFAREMKNKLQNILFVSYSIHNSSEKNNIL